MENKARLFSFYLPQYHPIPENDQWWGKGFTEWTNVTKAKPLFKGHRQPKLPGELGFYDLRVPEVVQQQASLAKEYGVESFCYWHYWFGNERTLLEKPFQQVVNNKAVDVGFCLAWANITWGGLPYGDGFDRILMEQLYPGEEDYKKHFEYLLPAFKDKRYTRIGDKPVFLVYHPRGLPDAKKFIAIWNDLAIKNGLPGIYFIAMQHPGWPYEKHGFDAITFNSPSHLLNRLPRSLYDKISLKLFKLPLKQLKSKLLGRPEIYQYKEVVKYNDYSKIKYNFNFFPCVMPNWDHSPRSKHKAQIFVNSTPELFYRMLQNAYPAVKDRKPDERIIFIKAWNEWAEGNFLEPDAEHGRGFLEAIKKFQQG